MLKNAWSDQEGIHKKIVWSFGQTLGSGWGHELFSTPLHINIFYMEWASFQIQSRQILLLLYYLFPLFLSPWIKSLFLCLWFYFQNFNSSKSLALLENLISVICHDLCGVVNMKSINEQLVPLHNLFSALQTSLIYWCWQHLNSTSELSKATAKDIVLRCKLSFLVSV